MIATGLLGGIFDYDKKKHEIEELEEKAGDPSFWNDPKKAEQILKETKLKKGWANSYDALTRAVDDTNTLYEFFKSGDATEEETVQQFTIAQKQLEDIEFKNMLSSEDDALGCVLQINAGAGGTESCDWASMLMRM